MENPEKSYIFGKKEKVDCPTCGGDGMMRVRSKTTGNTYVFRSLPCTECGGEGKIKVKV